MKNSNDECLEVFTRRQVEGATLWLHGQGVSADDLTPILKNLTRSRELGLHYLAPNAPVRNLSVNNGRPTRAWFDMVENAESDDPICEGLEESCDSISRLLDEEATRGMPSRQTILAGFSQGGTLALHAGLQYSEPLAGILVLSSALIAADKIPKASDSANGETPILMIHGEEDDVVPLSVASEGRDYLRSLGYQVDWKTLPLGHTVSMEEVELMDDWIYSRIAESETAST